MEKSSRNYGENNLATRNNPLDSGSDW